MEKVHPRLNLQRSSRRFQIKIADWGDGEDKDHGFIRDYGITRIRITDLIWIIGFHGFNRGLNADGADYADRIADLIRINGLHGF